MISIPLTISQVVPVDVGGSSDGITVSPDGKRAYVSIASDSKLVEIGGQRTLRISKQGGGIGTVRTNRGGIYCGNTCNASFDTGEIVRLSAIADIDSNSRFDHWGGDADCRDGQVIMTDNLICVAYFALIVRPSPPSTGSGSSDCFIATAAYGSWLDPHVLTLREFRDNYLLTNYAGTWFVNFYYRHSPPIADYIREREGLKLGVRLVLTPVVYAIEYPFTASFLVMFLWAVRLRNRKLMAAFQG